MKLCGKRKAAGAGVWAHAILRSEALAKAAAALPASVLPKRRRVTVFISQQGYHGGNEAKLDRNGAIPLTDTVWEKPVMTDSFLYRVAPTGCAVTFFAPGRTHQMKPPAITRPIAMSCVPDMAPPKTEPRPGSSRRNSRKKRATP